MIFLERTLIFRKQSTRTCTSYMWSCEGGFWR